MSTDIKSVISTYWDAAVATKGLLDYEEETSHADISYGITFQISDIDIRQLGNTFARSAVDAGDLYDAFIVGETDSTSDAETLVRNQLKALIKACDAFIAAGGNAVYDAFYPSQDNVGQVEFVADADNKRRTRDRKIAKLQIQCTKNHVAQY